MFLDVKTRKVTFRVTHEEFVRLQALRREWKDYATLSEMIIFGLELVEEEVALRRLKPLVASDAIGLARTHASAPKGGVS